MNARLAVAMFADAVLGSCDTALPDAADTVGAGSKVTVDLPPVLPAEPVTSSPCPSPTYLPAVG